MTKVVEEKPDNPAADSEVVSTSEAARQLGVSVRTIQLWVESGRLAAWKTAGNHRRVYQYSIDEYKEGRAAGGAHGEEKRHDECILVIEDDRTTQVYYETMLQLLEVEADIELVSNGLRGLLAVGRFEPWLVIRVQVVVISNVSHKEALERGLPTDCPFYPKPISLDDFSQAVLQARTNYQSS